MEDETIAQIVAKDYRTAAVFKEFGIDFCCGGKISLAEVCKQKGIDKKELLKDIQAAQENTPEKSRVENLEMDALCDYIIQTHHSYVSKRLPEIEPFLDKVVRVHGESHPELKKVQKLFNGVKEELTSHMQKEEMVLFPYIKEMMSAKKENGSLMPPPFGNIQNPIRMMEQEHELVGNAFKEIRSITNDLTPPENACNTYCVTFSMLDEFENDLHRHIHLENNVLFPKAIALEEQML